MGKYVIEKKVDVADLVKTGLKATYEVGFGSIYWNLAKNSFRSMNPIGYFGAKVIYGTVGAGLGKWLYSFVDEVFDVEDKVDKIFGKSETDDPVTEDFSEI